MKKESRIFCQESEKERKMYFVPKSKNLYIIGNGFDLYLGLKTSYCDFFKHKDNEKDLNYLEIRKTILEDINKKAKNIEKGATPKIEINKNTSIPAEIKENLFLLYLILEENEKTINWHDVEKKILKANKEMNNLFEKLEENRYLKILGEEKIKYGTRLGKESYLIKTLGEKNFNFLKELNEFEKMFGNYIKVLNSKIFNKNENNEILFDNFLLKIKRIFLEDQKNENFIINFNYTTYLKEIDYISEMVNVHGTFENPIFGIDNTEIGNDREFYYLTKTSRVLFNNTIKEDFKLPNKLEISKICFFGHSLARADYSYFQSIFDYYDIYNSEVKLEFKYYNYIKNDEKLTDEEKEERKDEVKSNMHKSVIELMNDYGNTASNKSKGQNLLHKLILENRIKIVEVE